MDRQQLKKAIESFNGKVIPKKLFHKTLKKLGLRIVGSTIEDSPGLSSHYYYVSDDTEKTSIFVGLTFDEEYNKVIGVDTSIII